MPVLKSGNSILYIYIYIYIYRLPGWLSGKESACDAEDAGDAAGSIPGSPGGGCGNPL